MRGRTILITTRASAKRAVAGLTLWQLAQTSQQKGIDRRARRHARPAVSRAVWMAMHPACNWAYHLPQQASGRLSSAMPGPSSARARRLLSASSWQNAPVGICPRIANYRSRTNPVSLGYMCPHPGYPGCPISGSQPPRAGSRQPHGCLLSTRHRPQSPAGKLPTQCKIEPVPKCVARATGRQACNQARHPVAYNHPGTRSTIRAICTGASAHEHKGACARLGMLAPYGAPRTQRACPPPIASRRRAPAQRCCARRRCESARSCGRRKHPGR